MPNITHTAKVKHRKIENITITLEHASKQPLVGGTKKKKRIFFIESGSPLKNSLICNGPRDIQTIHP